MSNCLSADGEVCGILLACYQQSLFWPEPDCSHILEPHVFQTPGRGFEQQYVVLIAFQTDSGDSGIWRHFSLYQF